MDHSASTDLSDDFLPLDCVRVPSSIWKKADAELHENPESREKCLHSIRMMIQEEIDFEPNMDEEFLLRFLRARKFDCRRAFHLMKMYYSHRVRYPKLYENYSPSHLMHVMKCNMMNFLPYRSPSGCAIWVSRIGQWDPEQFSYEDSLRLGLMCMEVVSRNPVTQICGVVNILDLRGFSWRQLIHFSPGRLRCFVTAMQDSFPLRQKETHVVNHPAIFSFFYALISPLLTEKIRKRILLHGSDMRSLHTYLPPEILPEDYGGQLGPFQNQEFYKKLLESEEDFIEHAKFGYTLQ